MSGITSSQPYSAHDLRGGRSARTSQDLLRRHLPHRVEQPVRKAAVGLREPEVGGEEVAREHGGVAGSLGRRQREVGRAGIAAAARERLPSSR